MSASRHASAAGKRAETVAAVMALTILVATAQSTPAQQAPEGTPAAWRVECAGDGKTLDCRAVQQVFHRETRQLVASALVRPAADGKSGAMVITLPLGLNLTEPVLVKVDNGTAERQSIQTCTNVGCFVAMTLTDKFIAAMRAGSDLKITVQDANKKTDRNEPATARLRHCLRQGQMTRNDRRYPMRPPLFPLVLVLALATGASAQSAGKLSVSVSGLRNDSGSVRC